MDPGRVRIIVNPAAGRGRGARALDRVTRAFAGIADVVTTRAAGDEARLVHDALRDDVATIVAVGGDGTWSKCAIALAKAGGAARIAFLAAGTGNDFAKNLGDGRGGRGDRLEAERLAHRLREGRFRERRVDLGRVDDHWFLNVAGFGFDVAVLRATIERPARVLRGPALYVATAVRELVRCDGIDCRLAVGEGGALGAWQRRLLLVFSNGAHFGGAFHVAPGARVDDGALDAIAVADPEEDATRPVRRAMTRATLLTKALRGAHLRDPRVTHARHARFTVEFREPPSLEVDGELCKADGVRCEVASVPAVLRAVDVAEGNG